MINEVKIENFRGFASLELKDLKRVNLLVGENDSGKTSLLEAVLPVLNEDDPRLGPGARANPFNFDAPSSPAFACS